MKRVFFAAIRAAWEAFVAMIIFVSFIFAFCVLWVYTKYGLEFFGPGDDGFKFLVQVVCFLIFAVYCGRAGTILHQFREQRKARQNNKS